MKEVIIYGLGHTRTLCSFDKETWTVNSSWKNTQRVDLAFELHDYMTTGEYELLKEKQITVVSKKPIEGLKCIVYPLDEIIQTFNTRYFANTVAYMIAYAMLNRYERIELYGIDHAIFSEYVLAKAGVEYWVGRAEQSGIEIVIPKESALCKTPNEKLYGYETDFFNCDKHEKVMVANTIK